MSRSFNLPKWSIRALAVCLATGMGASIVGCGEPPNPEATVPPSASTLKVVGEDTELVRAAGVGHQLFITVPGSTGCDWIPNVADIRSDEERIYIELTSTGLDPCAANLILRTHELTVEPDVEGYEVYVRFHR